MKIKYIFLSARLVNGWAKRHRRMPATPLELLTLHYFAHSDSGNSASEQIETHFVGPAEADHLCRDHTILMDVKTWLVLSGFAAGGSVG